MNSIKGKSKHHANYILCERCFKCNILRVVNSGSTTVNGGNEGFLCEVIFSLKCINATKIFTISFFVTSVIQCNKQFEN